MTQNITMQEVQTMCKIVGDCHIWQGKVHQGFPYLGGSICNLRRWVYAINHNLPDTWYLSHRTRKVYATCKNKLCLNPAHLFEASAGTMYTIAHYPDRAGKENVNVRLTEDQVLDIKKRRNNTPVSLDYLAKEFGVSKTQIWRISTGKSWKHL